jgi:hypothetical protein
MIEKDLRWAPLSTEEVRRAEVGAPSQVRGVHGRFQEVLSTRGSVGFRRD